MEATIWAAARRGDVESLSSLVKTCPSIDELDDFGVTALMVRGQL